MAICTKVKGFSQLLLTMVLGKKERGVIWETCFLNKGSLCCGTGKADNNGMKMSEMCTEYYYEEHKKTLQKNTKVAH